MKILIVEDEQDLRETIRTSLLKEKFVVETAADYFSALDKINDYDYDSRDKVAQEVQQVRQERGTREEAVWICCAS